METRFLSRFTPSLMPPDVLEAIFVQREGLLKEILGRIRTSALTPERKNTLLVGPRGIGKTHLTSLIHHRLQSMQDIQDRILVAWTREEEWGIAGFRDLLFRILRAIVPEDDARLKGIFALLPGEAEPATASLIRAVAGGRTLVVLVENLDDLVRKLGNQGEMQFYQFLTQNRCCLIATSPGPTPRVFPPGSPFRNNFFQVHPLKELDFETAVLLIAKIAEYQGNRELLSLLNTPRGRARVRALRYLAGGNHRAYVIFAPLLTQESIGTLIGPLMQTIDDLTPYYNSRIAVLPWEQRQILEYICETRHPVRVGDIARMCFLPATAAMAQSDTLCALGHLQTLRIGADIYYELREPLMRVSFEVKKHRGKPIGLLLDFLRLWYSPAELKQKFSVLSAKSVPEQIFIPDLQTLEQKWEDPTIAECCRDYAEAAGKGDYERALEATEELVAIRGLKQDMVAQASCLVRLGRLERAGAVCDQLVGSNPEDASLWRLRASILNGLGRYEEALSSCQESLELDPVSGETWNFEASILLHLGRSEEALHCSEAALKLNENDAVALITAGTALADLNLFDLSSKAFLLAVELQPQNTTARLHLCAALIELNRWDEALEQAQHALEMTPNEPEPWVLQGSVLAGMGRKMEALAAFSKAVSNGADSAFVRFKIVELLLSQNRWREAAAQLDRALEKFAQSEDPNAVDTKAMVRSLLPSLSEPRILKLLIQVLLLVYRKHRMIGALAQGLIVCIPDVISSESISDAGSSLWSESWDLMASDLPEFQLPLRLLDSAVRYRNSRDMSVLMKLSQEERTLLEALLGVHVEAIA